MFAPRYEGQDACSLKCRPQNVNPTCPPALKVLPDGVDRHAMRRARLRAAVTETFTSAEIFERDGWQCGICREPVERGAGASRARRASLDHVVPLARGGSHTRANVQCAHWICNSRKSARVGF